MSRPISMTACRARYHGRGARRQVVAMFLGASPTSARLAVAWAVRNGGHRPQKLNREEDDARANQLMRPVEERRKRPGREAGLRYSAGRAQRGRVVPLHL
jgi:hypothetical protein